MTTFEPVDPASSVNDLPPEPDHSECINPHIGPDGEHADCDGNPL